MAEQAEQAEPSEESRLIITDPPSKATSFEEWGGAIWHVIREEFRLKCFGFNFPERDVFYTAQWRSPRILFLLYRLAIALYMVTFLMLNLTILPKSSPDRPWPVFLTNWSYFILTTHIFLAAVNTALHYQDKGSDHGGLASKQRDTTDIRSSGDDPDLDDDMLIPEHEKTTTICGCTTTWYLQLDWLIYCIAIPSAIQIMIRYNAHDTEYHIYNFKDINNHIINGVIAFIDLCICAIPVRLVHFVYSAIYFGCYYVFSYIFYEIDPANNVLYPASTDWRCPNETMVTYAIQGILYPIALQLCLFAIYRLKVYVCKRCHF